MCCKFVAFWCEEVGRRDQIVKHNALWDIFRHPPSLYKDCRRRYDPKKCLECRRCLSFFTGLVEPRDSLNLCLCILCTMIPGAC